ncbi:MAG TPA: hypothetical protein PK299_14185 [Anaerolineales bacterium]|nr:hypothetical protein [Anaerolineales bacterium]
MNWLYVLIFSLILCLIWIAIFRTVPNRRGLVFLFFILPSCSLLALFAWFWQYRWEGLIAFMVSIGLYILFEGFFGHRLASPNDKNIKVWGQED